jgi:ribulose-5-phosphate 4-epimerase/fuculose-1-phosphate aldolase
MIRASALAAWRPASHARTQESIMPALKSLAEVPSLRQRVSDDEWQARIELAAAYRLVAHYGWTHMINNHISVRVPGTADQFLINPYGLLYEQITASSLIKIDLDGKVLDETPYEVNRAGFVIHSAIHMARDDLHAIIHTHTVAGQAVSALDCGILPLNQTAMRFYNRVGCHEFEGVASDLDERERIVADLGPHKCLILKHHGLLTAGVNVAEAFNLMYYFEKTCETQMAVLASNQRYSLPSPAACEKAEQQFWGNGRIHGQRDWPALMKLAESIDPSFRN